MFGNGNCCWIIILLLLFCGNDNCGNSCGNSCGSVAGCGTNNNCNCCNPCC